MRHVPFVGIFGADTREIRSGALRAPLERVVVHALRRERIMAIAFDLVTQRPDHLRVAEIAAFPDVDIATGKLQRGIRPDSIDHLDRTLEIEQRGNLDEATDRDHREDAHDEDDRVLLENMVPGPERHWMFLTLPAGERWATMQARA